MNERKKMLQSTFFYLFLIVFCFNLMFALPASSMNFSSCNPKQRLLSILKNVIQACYYNLNNCIDGKIVMEGRFLLYSEKL